VIATQSLAEPLYGQIGLDLMRGGFTANEALTALRSVDPTPSGGRWPCSTSPATSPSTPA
jgi:uncharacterized Ntn-hydrolase superfamily protein